MYDNLLPSIRNAARALIIRGGQVLLLRKEGVGEARGFHFRGERRIPVRPWKRRCSGSVAKKLAPVSLFVI